MGRWTLPAFGKTGLFFGEVGLSRKLSIQSASTDNNKKRKTTMKIAFELAHLALTCADTYVDLRAGRKVGYLRLCLLLAELALPFVLMAAA